MARKKKQAKSRDVGTVLADLAALPVGTDPVRNLPARARFQELVGEIRAFEPGQLPEQAAPVLLGLLDRMVGPDGYQSTGVPRASYADHEAIMDCWAALYELVPLTPGYLEALLDLVKRHSNAWSADLLIMALAERYPGFTARTGVRL